MRRKTLIPLLLCVLACTAHAQVHSDNPLRTPLDKLTDSVTQAAFARGECVGVSIGVIRNGQTHIYNYGETVKGNKTLPDARTVYEIGSITKTFTATLLALQVSRGRIGLNDPLVKYLPDTVPAPAFEGTPVTMAMLSNHSSGLPRLPYNFNNSTTVRDNPYSTYSNDWLFQFMKRYAMERKPGERYEYSNLGAGLLGVLLARFAHTTYEQLLEREITRPLQLQDTKVNGSSSMKSRLAQGYTGTGQEQGPWDFLEMAGLGGIRSTLHDMLIYARANMSTAPTLLEKAIALTHQPTFTGGQQTVGLGWHIQTRRNGTIVQHNGQTGGYYAFIAVNPAARTAVVMLSNVSKANGIAARLLAQL